MSKHSLNIQFLKISKKVLQFKYNLWYNIWIVLKKGGNKE